MAGKMTHVCDRCLLINRKPCDECTKGAYTCQFTARDDSYIMTGAESNVTQRRLIAAGGYGEVYEYYDHHNNQAFARKIFRLFGDLERRKEIAETFVNEARVITKLCQPGTHANIIAVLRQGAIKDTALYYIDMELCDATLEQFMQEHSLSSAEPTDMEQIWSIMWQIARGVAFIHGQGEVHRDIKPRNILYSKKDGVWKIGDFGLTSEGTSETLQTTKYSRGTEGYRAPELVTEKRKYNNKVDIWSMGCVLYELVSGRKRFANDWEVFKYCHTPNHAPFLSSMSITEPVRELLLEIIYTMLDVNPSRRPPARSLVQTFASQYELYQGRSSTMASTSSAQSIDNIISLNASIRIIIGCVDCALIATVPWTDGHIDLWEAGYSNPRRTFDHGDEVFALALGSHNSRLLASGGKDHAIIFWDVESGIRVFQLRGRDEVHSLAFNPSDSHLACGIKNGMIEFLSITDRGSAVADRAVLHAHLGPTLRLEYSSDGLYLCSSSRHGVIIVWSSVHCTQVCRIEAGLEGRGTFSLHPLRHDVLSWEKMELKVWDRNTGQKLQSVHPPAEMSCCTYTPCGRYIISGHSDNHIRIWDASNLALLKDVSDSTPLRLQFCRYKGAPICVIMTEFTIRLLDYERKCYMDEPQIE